MILRFYGMKRTRVAAALAAMLMLKLSSPLFAARPTAARLLPENTVFMVSIPNARELAEKFTNTSLGKILQDPQMKPLVEQIYGSLGELVATAKEQIGLSLSEIVALPQGEITFAVVAPEQSVPAFAFIFDAGDQIGNARVLLERGKQALEKTNWKKREETIAEVKCTIYERAEGSQNQAFVIFEKDSAVAVTQNIDVAKQVLELWAEKKDVRSLAENANYGAIASRCRGSRDEEPQLVWYADPVGIVKAIGQQNAGAQIAAAMLPALGLDGLSGVGGSILFDTEQYDSMMHLHVLLTSPRTGVLKVIAFEPGSAKPERWVPGDVASYITLNWNFETSLTAIESLFDSFRGDGAFEQTLQNFFTRQTDVDLKKQILPVLDGRVTILTWFEKPITLQSQTRLLAIKLKDKERDVEAVQTILDNLVKKAPPGQIDSQNSAGKQYYLVKIPAPNFPDGREPPPMPRPCFGIVEDYLVIANQPSIYERVLATAADSTKSLGNELDFKLIASKLERVAGETKPAMLSFDRPEEAMRFLYDLATSDRAKTFLQRQSERNPFFKSLNSSLEKQPLPPFSAIQKYLAPGGSIVVDDETGIHLLNFTLKRQGE
ncbi:MAG: hypothetical protein IT426_10155 [Pirellulales bacterium]|nr:hypothetical protein [Pirellulales bacterium]